MGSLIFGTLTGAGVGLAAVEPCSCAKRMSLGRITPPAPVATTSFKSTFSFFASALTAGAIFTFPTVEMSLTTSSEDSISPTTVPLSLPELTSALDLGNVSSESNSSINSLISSFSFEASSLTLAVAA